MIKTEDRERNIQILNEYKEVGVMQLVMYSGNRRRCLKPPDSCATMI